MANNSTVHRLGDVCGAGFYSGDSFPQPATPHRYFSRREHANAPPRSMVVVSDPGRIYHNMLDNMNSRKLHLPRACPPRAVPHNGTRLLRTQAFRQIATAYRRTSGLTRSTMIRSFLQWRAHFPFLSAPRRLNQILFSLFRTRALRTLTRARKWVLLTRTVPPLTNKTIGSRLAEAPMVCCPLLCVFRLFLFILAPLLGA